MKYVIKNKDTGKIIKEETLEEHMILYTQVNSVLDEAWVYVKLKSYGVKTNEVKNDNEKVSKEFRR